MSKQTAIHKRRLLGILTLLLVVGFLATSLISYFVSVTIMRQQIVTNSLPLTSDTIYSEIQRDLLAPVFIASLMAHDVFLRDWLLNGETDREQIRRYLLEIKEKYGAYSSFLISEKSREYYYGGGVLKKITEDEPRDAWYFRVRSMIPLYETNLDPDMANKNALTVFVNYKVFGYAGDFLGVTGVGLTIHSIEEMMEHYSRTYGRSVYFTDAIGKIVLRNSSVPEQAVGLRDMLNTQAAVAMVLDEDVAKFKVRRKGVTIHVNSRHIPELQWCLVVEQSEGSMMQQAFRALLVNLAFCVLLTGLVLCVTYVSVGGYQVCLDQMIDAEKALRQVTTEQKKALTKQHEELIAKTAEVQRALAEVKQLSGLLPICSSCKKIRDDDGYWNQIENYIGERSNAQFSHGLCPDCIIKLYPEYASNRISEIDSTDDP